ncbi:hypothetical protein Godav_028641 [Gossypium davidsonii]|uniref:Uncharacterized protein n=1 Tax=Gossypium davidsonii TaxID=34287 RepID=A0A7J8S044_GOSDV|nr:hypothetical protein [Gossypium davidsonii]
MVSNKVERRVEQLAPQQLQKRRQSSLSSDRHGEIMRRKQKLEMKKPKWKFREQK